MSRLILVGSMSLAMFACGPKSGSDATTSEGGTDTGTDSDSGPGSTGPDSATGSSTAGSSTTSTTATTDSSDSAAVTTDGSASTTSTTTTATATTETSVGETGTPECVFSSSQEACEEPYCIGMNGYEVMETVDGACYSPRPTYLGCVECYGFESGETLCKDGVKYQVSGLCEPELWKFLEAGYEVCDPPPQPLEQCRG